MIWTAVGTSAIGCGLMIASLCLPPSGEIDNSVLIAFGEFSTFAATLFGVKIKNKPNPNP